MKTFRPYVSAVGVVSAWAVFAYAYLGVEDGSSGLSPLGWVQVLGNEVAAQAYFKRAVWLKRMSQ